MVELTGMVYPENTKVFEKNCNIVIVPILLLSRMGST